jgi:hypothetical protein
MPERYLEPFSFVCNEIISAATPGDAMAYANVGAKCHFQEIIGIIRQ